MKHLSLIFLLIAALSIVSCSKDDDSTPGPTEQTLLMYFPWSGNLTYDFWNNISQMEKSIKQNNLKNERVLVFICKTVTEAELFELKQEKGSIVREPLKEYSFPTHEYTTVEGITAILNDITSLAEASRYAMTIGGHGSGWIPSNSSWNPYKRSRNKSYHTEMFWYINNAPQTRSFGCSVGSPYQTDITTLVQGISNAGIKMEYILFDNCNMSNIELAYEVKNVANYIIACPTEIMSQGMPYHKIGKHLLGNVNYKGICDDFLNYYKNEYESIYYRCGTIGVIKCSELDELALIMKEINEKHSFDESKLYSIQKMDGYNPIVFFDYGDYVNKLCTNNDLLNKFQNQLNLVIPHKRHTEEYYSSNIGKVPINTYSGVTISDPSNDLDLAIPKTQTSWYAATH